MVQTIWQRIRTVDWLLFTPMFFLLLISLTVSYSLSVNPVTPEPGLFRRQLLFAVIAIIAFFFVSTLNYRTWSVYSKVLYIGGIAILLYVLFLGVTIRGTTGWISVGFANFQPVEFAKIALLVFLAKYFSDHGRLFFLWRHTILSGLATLVFVGLVLQQPDLGSAMVMAGTWFLMLFIVGIPKKQLFILLVTVLIAGVVAWLFVLQPYQKNRVMTFINPSADELGVGYNVRQSIIAVGSGQLLGRGFGLGSQSQLKFLPEPETDFIFAVVAEEFGFIGAVFVIGGLLLIIGRLLTIANQTKDNFAAYFSLGVASLLSVQSFINIGMNMGIAPVTGIPLPFISAGGSSLLSLGIALGIVSSIVSDQRTLSGIGDR